LALNDFRRIGPWLALVEQGLLLAMGSIAFGAWALMLLRLLSDFHPIFELATHTSLHVFVGCLLVLGLEVLFFLLRRNSVHAGPRWKRRLVFTLVPLIFFAWVTTPWRLLPLKKAQQEAGSIKILSWNMLLVNRNYDDVLELVRREQPDILLLIELSPLASKQLESLRAIFPYSHSLPAWEGCGIGMLSRVPHSSFRTIYLANHWMPAIELEIEREDGKGRLSLLGTHTVSPHLDDQRRTNFRNQQLKDLGRWAAEQPGGAMIIGDLNVTPWSPPFWRLIEEGRLEDSSWYRGYFPSWPTILQSMGIPIDHALVNEKIHVLDRRNVYGRSNSDHYPMVISIQ
jgi:endonuclease/exonuclease/phosphatase (EEP) superfamily protein YafD